MQTKKVKQKRVKKLALGLIFGIIPLAFILYLLLGPLLHIISRDLSAKEMYVISEEVNVRSDADIKSLKMGTIYYGTKVLCYETTDGWAKVLLDKHQVFINKKFIADTKSFHYLNGLFGDKNAQKKIINAKYRMALVRYLISKGYSSKISDKIRKEIDNESEENQVYQLFTEPYGSKFNTVVFGDFDGDFRQDVAFVITNKKRGFNRLVILSLDRENPYTMSKTLYDKELEKPWQYIGLAKKGHNYKKGDEENFKLPLTGLLIGSNRNKDLKDSEYLLLYNGSKFEMFEQEKEK